ncbi:hypothetical protein TcWFU_001311 [Taenia crassiceps]|uniref:Galactosylgalactosylxylosylprotein 3-beta-glucuronosyltransferase n=1 Tax=Taenia crassiceps TaxID=6207 RepID=A0ABR4QAG6_9CEST
MIIRLINDPVTPRKTTVYVITPTYQRWTQKADLVRLCSTLNNVDFIHWIVVEDAMEKSEMVCEVLSECGVPYTHLFAISPFRRRKRVRGSAQRNKGIEWIRNHPLPNTEKGIVFFADDDNTYDPRIFKEMRTTQLGSTWPVGLVGGSSAYELEPKADGCSKIFVWHTQTRTPVFFPYFGFQPPPPSFV